MEVSSDSHTVLSLLTIHIKLDINLILWLTGKNKVKFGVEMGSKQKLQVQ